MSSFTLPPNQSRYPLHPILDSNILDGSSIKLNISTPYANGVRKLIERLIHKHRVTPVEYLVKDSRNTV